MKVLLVLCETTSPLFENSRLEPFDLLLRVALKTKMIMDQGRHGYGRATTEVFGE